MKRNKWLSRVVSGLLAAVLVLSLCPAVSAAEGRVSIGTLEELTAFAQRCASDRYSEGLEAVLTADIDAGGTAVSIPIFLGSFDGQGHKITGLRLEESNSVYGLFSRIEAGGTVQNLTIEGEVSPSGTQNKVGGLAGENYGSIEGCRFSGLVSGGEAVGGIAGYNEGTVTDCTVSGVIRGTRYTGGIAGQNAGTLLRCENGAAVNTTVTEETWSADDLENLESSLYSILKKEDVEETAVTTDTGGVAGYSTGAIQSCVNTGSVGYPHVGYNVGGIAGRQNGYLASCVNRGDIQGRKDVGGIVGQMVPDITLDTSPGALEELQNELNTLQNLIDRTLDDAQSASDTVSGRVSRISGYADSAQDSAHTLTGQVGDFVDNNVSTANNLLLLAERYIGKAAPILSELSAAARSVADTISEARELLEMLDDGLAYNDQFLAQLQSFYTETKAACDDLAAALDELERALELIDDGPALPDTSQLRADIDALREAAGNLEATIGRAMEEIGHQRCGNAGHGGPASPGAQGGAGRLCGGEPGRGGHSAPHGLRGAAGHERGDPPAVRPGHRKRRQRLFLGSFPLRQRHGAPPAGPGDPPDHQRRGRQGPGPGGRHPGRGGPGEPFRQGRAGGLRRPLPERGPAGELPEADPDLHGRRRDPEGGALQLRRVLLRGGLPGSAGKGRGTTFSGARILWTPSASTRWSRRNMSPTSPPWRRSPERTAGPGSWRRDTSARGTMGRSAMWSTPTPAAAGRRRKARSSAATSASP